jgi:hypothetical protein
MGAVQMKKFAGVVVVAGLAFAFSGCFLMRTLTFTDDTVDAGKKTTAKISVSGDTTDMKMMMRGGLAEHPFFFVVSEGGSKAANGGSFDTESVFDGPVPLKTNSDLADAASDQCESATPIRRGPTFTLSAVTTVDPFDADNSRKFMDTKLPIKASEFGNGDALAIFMGTWGDDGDGTPELEGDGDSYDCQPPYVTLLKIKGGAPPPP